MSWKRAQFRQFAGNFGGLNTWQSPDQLLQGDGRDNFSETPDELNFYSWPSGSMTKLFGHANLNTTALESGSAIQGLAYLAEISSTLAIIVNGKFYEHVNASTQTDRTGSVTITDGQDNLVDVALIANLALFTDRQRDAPWKWTGSGANIAALGGSPPSGRYCAAFKRRAWIFNTSANPEYGYFSGLDDPESWDQTNDLLNFDTKDGSVITSATVLGESLYVGKEGANANSGHLFRVFATGGDPPFQFEEVPTGGIGPVSQQATLAFNGRLYFLGKDNLYVLEGNQIIPIGNPIILTLREFSKTRFEFSSAGILRERNLIAWSFSLTGATTHNRTFLYDYGVSSPGKRDVWHPCSWAVNAMTERVASGTFQLITGGYDGFYEQQLSGETFAGSGFSAYRQTPWLNLGDPFTLKKIKAIYVLLRNTGNNVSVRYRTDFSTGWSTAVTISAAGGSRLGSFVLGTDVLGGSDAVEGSADVTVEARRIQLEFANNNSNQPITVFAFGVLYRPMRRTLVFA